MKKKTCIENVQKSISLGNDAKCGSTVSQSFMRGFDRNVSREQRRANRTLLLLFATFLSSRPQRNGIIHSEKEKGKASVLQKRQDFMMMKKKKTKGRVFCGERRTEEMAIIVKKEISSVTSAIGQPKVTRLDVARPKP